MRTLVIQSYRTENVPGWLARCMESVQAWAREHGFDYRFVDDRLFDAVPDWYRKRCGRQILPVTDLARLVLLRDALRDEGYEWAVWLDADMLVFDAPRLRLDASSSYAFARECWLSRDARGAAARVIKVNNSVTLMRRDNPVLEFLIHAAQQVVAVQPVSGLRHDAVSTAFLSALATGMPLPVVKGAGLIGPLVIAELARGGDEFTRLLADSLTEPLAAVNLCGSLVGSPVYGVTIAPGEMDIAIDRLQRTGGEAINGFRSAAAGAGG